MTKLQRKKFIEKTFSGTEVGILVEEFTGKVTLVAEGQSSLREEMRQEFKEAQKEIANFKSETNSNFKELFMSKKENQDNFKVTFEYLSKLEDELAKIKDGIKKIKPEKTSMSDYLSLKNRVLRLEEKLEKFQSQGAAFAAKT